MTVWWLAWIATFLLAMMCRQSDYPVSGNLVLGRVRHSNSAKHAYVIASIILIMFAGCRYYVGTDFGGYYRLYESTVLDLERSIRELDEPGIRLIYTLATKIHDSGGMCIMTIAAVTLGLELSTIYKNTENIGFALALFVLNVWSACFNGVRQALATSVLLCGLPALRDKKFKKFAFIVVLAYLCHRSSIVMILIYFIVHREASGKNIFILVILSVVVLFSYDKVYAVVNAVLDNDVTGEEAYWSTQVNFLRVLTNMAPAVLFVYLYRREEKTPAVSFYLNLLVLHAVVAVVTSNSACLARMVMYTTPFSVIAMAELIKLLPGGQRGMYSKLIVFLYWVMALYEVLISGELNNFQLRWFW